LDELRAIWAQVTIIIEDLNFLKEEVQEYKQISILSI